MSDVRAREVAWYRQNGKYPERVKRDGHGREFVIGDHSWNMAHPDKPEQFEYRFQRDTGLTITGKPK